MKNEKDQVEVTQAGYHTLVRYRREAENDSLFCKVSSRVKAGVKVIEEVPVDGIEKAEQLSKQIHARMNAASKWAVEVVAKFNSAASDRITDLSIEAIEFGKQAAADVEEATGWKKTDGFCWVAVTASEYTTKTQKFLDDLVLKSDDGASKLGSYIKGGINWFSDQFFVVGDKVADAGSWIVTKAYQIPVKSIIVLLTPAGQAYDTVFKCN